ncbi:MULTISPECIES: M4 family metallopeptidase [unclassified Nocardioides]|uniref:M4 family metallopeptidase n=1 Tax=unclassified Nocardioides TaxID=2615069 RepID=UPI002666B3D7|nr:M4 family metallopeptidase [Nocardioides sp. Arc9.136]WKN46945.1 M4 family metallopeptidase [Nocardioides sp. Arc9.136]
MKILKTGLSLVLLGAGVAAVPTQPATAAEPIAPADGRSLVQRLKSDAEGAVRLATEPATGKIGFARAARGGDLLPDVRASGRAGAVEKANAFLDRHARVFGATADQLRESSVQETARGWAVRFDQTYRGLPVFGGQLVASVDDDGDLTAVSGYVAPDLRLGTTPRTSAAEAGRRAVATVREDPPGETPLDLSGLRVTDNTLSVYRMGSVKGETGPARLVHVVGVGNGTTVREKVFVDALTGKFLNRYSMIHTALNRELREAKLESDGGTPDDVSDDKISYTTVYREGDPLPGSLDEDQLNEVNGTGEAYWFFKNTFGRDSFDGKGAKMVTVNNDPTIACPNANWNGKTTNYCSGVSSDDTVAHEWGHAYTEYTSGLVYQWQSGAMNEAFSDIWGETVDQINDRYNETPDVKRADGLCSAYTGAIPVLTITAPESIAKECATGGTLGEIDGPITGQVVAPTDAEEEGGTTTDGCSPYADASAAAGKIVLVDRGLCTFVEKAQVAKAAGAKAVIIGNREEAPIGFTDADKSLPPTVSIGLTDRETIRKTLADGQPVEVEIIDAGGDRFDSYRWLSGEGDPAFGGAIRDMWNPTCLGDPAKVSDAEYKCSTDDSGGVHSNSGVVNHAYALLVDGGTSNDVTVAGLGLDKAANIFWQTQVAHLTPTSNFVDLADGLEASCTELVGKDINRVSTDPGGTSQPAAEIVAGDCASVSAVVAATELRKDPTQCNFRPLLRKGGPATCGGGTTSKVLYKEDFEDGLAGWKKSERVAFKGGKGIPWRASREVTGNRSKVAFDPSDDRGTCTYDRFDRSSANAITSRAIRLRGGGTGMRLQFRHYVASELDVDGGNVKVKLGSGKWKVVKPAAYLFNAPNTTLLTKAEGNTNPMASQPAFSGTDGNVAGGSWGRSIIDLKKIGAKPGTKIKLRFEMGRDGCGGLEGWAVDDVKIVACGKKGGTKGRQEASDVR